MSPTTDNRFHLDQMVEVAPRTWAGINKLGGIGRVEKVHYSNGYIDCLDVKYIVNGGRETRIDLDFVSPHEYLSKEGRRSRRQTTTTQEEQRAATVKRKTPPQKQESVENKKAQSVKRKKPRAAPKQCMDETPASEAAVPSNVVTDTEQQLPTAVVEIKKGQSVELSPLPIGTPTVTTQRITKATTTHRANHASGKAQKKTTCARNDVKGKSCKKGNNTNSATKVVKTEKKKKPSSTQTTNKTVMPKKPPTKKKNKSSQKSNGPVLQKPVEKKKNNITGTAFLKPKPKRGEAEERRVPLQQVYDSEWRSAKNFVSDLMDKKTVKRLVVKPLPDKQAAFTMEQSRRDCFVGLFSELLRKKDGEIDSNTILDQVNKMLLKAGNKKDTPFSQKEVHVGLKHLNDCNKIMQCDDKVYAI